MCNYDSHLLSGRCVHFLEKVTGWTWLFVSLRLASVPGLQAGVENTVILSHPVEMVRWPSAQSSTWPGTLHSWGSSGGAAVLNRWPWERRQQHRLPLAPVGVWPSGYQGTGFAKKRLAPRLAGREGAELGNLLAGLESSYN